MEPGSSKTHSNDDKAVTEKIRKRTVKTPNQAQALENLYNEHKYPSQVMKLQLAQEIGLTETQVSVWFRHKRLRENKLANEEKCAPAKQDRCKRVTLECERLIPIQVSPVDLTNHHCVARRATPLKLSSHVVKPSSAPSGYLKVNIGPENAAMLLVKRQLGRLYQKDGPPVRVKFDPLPPDAFRSVVPQKPVQDE